LGAAAKAARLLSAPRHRIAGDLRALAAAMASLGR
jgi:hypothetical protein